MTPTFEIKREGQSIVLTESEIVNIHEYYRYFLKEEFVRNFCEATGLKLTESQIKFCANDLIDAEKEETSDPEETYLDEVIHYSIGVTKCDHCGKQNDPKKGFFVFGTNEYCSLKCLCKEEGITEDEYYRLCEEDGEVYWTQGDNPNV